jgi:hypothetical protein
VVVKEHSVSEVTPGALEKRMNMLHLASHCAS